MADNHPFVVRITYQNGAPYHIFVDSEMDAHLLVGHIEEEVNRGKRLFRYVPNTITPEYTLIVTLISLEGIRDIVTLTKDPIMSDTTWLG